MERNERPARLAILALCMLIMPVIGRGAVEWQDEPRARKVEEKLVSAELNGLKFEFDGRAGTLRRMSFEPVGDLLECESDRASIIDLAYPTETYGPLRLAPRFSEGCRFMVQPGRVTLIWDELGNSHPQFEKVGGAVRARVDLVALEDGRSVSMRAMIANQSDRPVPQVIFPDFSGLLPVAGAEHTYFRLTHRKMRPFVDLGRKPATAQPYYANGNGWSTPFFGGHNDDSCGRWFDYGGIKGGFSGFQREWGYGTPSLNAMLYRPEATPGKLRLYFDNQMQYPNGESNGMPISIAPGEVWQSPEFILTGHAGGWPKGIGPYRDWVRSHPNLVIADHVRDDIGFRTVWMTECAEFRPGEPSYFKWTDLPALARETLDHGMHEMVLFIATDWFALPLRPQDHLGTTAELQAATAECKKMGVDVTCFISCVAMSAKTCQAFGTTATSNAWTYHKDLIPMVNTHYAKWLVTGSVPTWREDWQTSVVESVRNVLDEGYFTSICWDSYNYKKPPAGVSRDMHSLMREIRALCRRNNPDAAVGSETIDNIEDDMAQLDYTWVWEDSTRYNVVAASVFASPRFAINIEDDGNAVRRHFLQNSYISAIPRVPDGANGSGWIKDQPEMSAALKECAALRKQFLPYFTEGIVLGEDVVDDVYGDLPIGGFQLPDRLLVILLNDTGEVQKDVKLGVNLADWLPTASNYSIRVHDSAGRPIQAIESNQPRWRTKIPELPVGMRLFEIIPERP